MSPSGSRRPVQPAPTAVSLERLDTVGMAGPLVVVRGEVDIGTASQLEDDLTAMLTREVRCWTVDLRGLAFCDLRGLDALRSAECAAQRAGSTVVWRGASKQLRWMADKFPVGAPTIDGDHAQPL